MRRSSQSTTAIFGDFEWDPDKEARNIRDRDLDFVTASEIWSGPIIERIDDRKDYGEIRIMAFGKANNRLMAVLYTRRGPRRRIISARKANRREQRRFEREFSDVSG